MSVYDMYYDNHYEGTCDNKTCLLCRVERGEITTKQFHDMMEGVEPIDNDFSNG